MNKAKRKERILDIINKTEVNTQEELIAILEAQGLKVTQATVSRDIKELGLVKVSGKVKKYKYAEPVEKHGDYLSRLTQFKSIVVSIERAQNLVVVKTLAGHGNAIAALIDSQEITDVLGTIAGDDTILVISADNVSAQRAVEALSQLFHA